VCSVFGVEWNDDEVCSGVVRAVGFDVVFKFGWGAKTEAVSSSVEECLRAA